MFAKTVFAASALVALAATSTGAAFAQDASCAKGAELLKVRQGLLQSFQGGGKKPKMTAGQACARLSALSANGNQLLAWIKEHGAWCNAPDSLAAGIQGQHAQVSKVRGQACGAASKQRQMEALAKRQQQNPENPFGPDDVTGGPRRLPAGAL
jgi:hypothetical protein